MDGLNLSYYFLAASVFLFTTGVSLCTPGCLELCTRLASNRRDLLSFASWVLGLKGASLPSLYPPSLLWWCQLCYSFLSVCVTAFCYCDQKPCGGKGFTSSTCYLDSVVEGSHSRSLNRARNVSGNCGGNWFAAFSPLCFVLFETGFSMKPWCPAIFYVDQASLELREICLTPCPCLWDGISHSR